MLEQILISGREEAVLQYPLDIGPLLHEVVIYFCRGLILQYGLQLLSDFAEVDRGVV